MNWRAGFLMTTVLCCGTAVHSLSQDTRAWSTAFPLPELTSVIELPEPVEKITQILDAERSGGSSLKAIICAAGMEVLLTPRTSGQWDTIQSRGLVWRLGIRAANAVSLNLLIENFSMHSGMALYVHGTLPHHTAGPFNARDNANGGVLPVQSLPGDMLVVEWNVPALSVPQAGFTITNVGYGFRSAEGVAGGAVPVAVAASCNIDVNCLRGNHWQREKRAVVRLETVTESGNTQYCTGTLINQAVDAGHKKPYILTANHCISSGLQAQRTTVVFGHENTSCDGMAMTVPARMSGSRLVATKKELDFSLLELTARIPDAYRPFYAGWNTSGAVPQSIVGIHHPQGGVKKISAANTLLTTGTFTDAGSDLYCDQNAHWLVRRWDEGVTEPGSSGSPVFDSEHNVVGVLSGGSATCLNPASDYYGKLSEQWNRYTATGESLKHWLDPDNTGAVSIWGYDPVAPYEGRYEMQGNIGESEARILIESEDWGYLTGHNDRQWTGFAEKISNDSVANIIGLEVYVAQARSAGTRVKFAVWHGTDFPVSPPLYVKDTVIGADYNNYPVHVYFDRTVTVSSDYFIGYSIEYSVSPDTFAVYQSSERQYPGLSAMYVEQNDGTWIAMDHYLPPVYSSLGVRAIGKFGKASQSNRTPAGDDLQIIYQPGNSNLSVRFDNFDANDALLRIECYDTSGKRVLLLNEPDGHMEMQDGVLVLSIELNVGSLSPGVYLISAFSKNKKRTGKFVKIL